MTIVTLETLYSSVSLKWLIDSKIYFLGKLSVGFFKKYYIISYFCILAKSGCSLEDKSFSSWQWDVTPKESGIQKLDFIVSVILRVPGYEELLVKGFEANTIEVIVKVNPSFSLNFFIKKEWKYLTLILVMLLCFIVKRFKGIMVNEGDTFNIGQAGAAGKFASSHNNTFVQSEQKVTLAEAAAEIQKLLKQLEKKNPTATEGEKIDYVNVTTNPDIKQRAIAALKAGGETASEEFLDNPYVNVAKAIIKGWIKRE